LNNYLEGMEMWIVHPDIGFISLSVKPWNTYDNTITVRARVKSDLNALRAKYLPSLSATKCDRHADYRFRATASRDDVAAAVAAMVRDCDYADTKAETERLHGPDRAIFYHSVWAALRRLQRSQPPHAPGDLPVIFAGIGRQRDVLDDEDDRPLPHDPSEGRT
jgi:hypothetical protein